jgi:hypothetical protein
LYSQSIGIGTQTPDASAALEIKDSTKGFLMPRMSTVQRDSIANPAEGLQIYNTSTNFPEIYRDGSWQLFVNVINSNFNSTQLDLQGYVQSADFTDECASTSNYLRIQDFDTDSAGNILFALIYVGNQKFYGETLMCENGKEQEVLMKFTKTGTLIWRQDITSVGIDGNLVPIRKVRFLSTGEIMLGLATWDINRTLPLNYMIGNHNFSTNGVTVNFIKLDANGQYISNRIVSGATGLTFFDVNASNICGAVYYNNSINYSSILIDVSVLALPIINQYSFPTTTNIQAIGMPENENSIYFSLIELTSGIKTMALYRINTNGLNYIISLGNTSGSSSTSNNTNNIDKSPKSIVFTGNYVHLISPDNWSINLNGSNTTSLNVYHIVIQKNISGNYSLTKIIELQKGSPDYCYSLHNINNCVSEFLFSGSSGGSDLNCFYMYKNYSDSGVIKNSFRKRIYISSTGYPIEISNICSYSNKLIIGGIYGDNFNPLVDGFLNFSLPPLMKNLYNPYLLYLNFPQ